MKSLPDIGGAFVFGDFALTGQQTINNLKLKSLGNFLNYEYKIKFFNSVNFDDGIKKVKEIFSNKNRIKIKHPENSAIGLKNLLVIFLSFYL